MHSKIAIAAAKTICESGFAVQAIQALNKFQNRLLDIHENVSRATIGRLHQAAGDFALLIYKLYPHAEVTANRETQGGR